jgi:hypothetical protein
MGIAFAISDAVFVSRVNVGVGAFGVGLWVQSALAGSLSSELEGANSTHPRHFADENFNE